MKNKEGAAGAALFLLRGAGRVNGGAGRTAAEEGSETMLTRAMGSVVRRESGTAARLRLAGGEKMKR